MKFKYYIFPEYKLILECYSGEFEFKDIFECKKLEIKDPDWKDYYDVLGDIRKANISLTKQDLVNMNTYFKNAQEINTKRKSAILTDRPSQVVFGTLLRGNNILKDSLVVPKVYSTVNSALLWLGVDEKENEKINKVLKQLAED